MADLRDVLAGQLVMSDRLPSSEECQDDPFVMNLDEDKLEYTGEFIPRHYVRYPLVGHVVPPMADVEKLARFANNILVHGRKVIFVSRSPVPRAMCAARALQLTVGGTIQNAILHVNRADDRAFADDRVLNVMLALGGSAT